MCNQIFSGTMNLSCLHYSFFFSKTRQQITVINFGCCKIQSLCLPIAIATSFCRMPFEQQRDEENYAKSWYIQYILFQQNFKYFNWLILERFTPDVKLLNFMNFYDMNIDMDFTYSIGCANILYQFVRCMHFENSAV